MCYIYMLTIDGEVRGALYEMISQGKVVYHNWETDEITIHKNKLVFEEQFYENKTVYSLQQTDTLFF